MLGSSLGAAGIFGLGVPAAPAVSSLTILLYAFCIGFAVNSSIHSYLIVRYSEGNKVAMSVGVYYRWVGGMNVGGLGWLHGWWSSKCGRSMAWDSKHVTLIVRIFLLPSG